MRFPGYRTIALRGLVLVGASGLLAAAEAPVQFNRDIRPILSDQCFSCHGFDAKHRKANLRLDLAEDAYAANKDGRIAVKPGDPAGSELWKRINTTDADDVMPPPESHKTLSPEQKALLKRWIEQGAGYQRHWAFETPVRPPVPPARAGTVIGNPVDAYVQKRLAELGLPQAPEADRRTLIRRVAFDLTGLPPTPTEVERFLADRSPDAYERMVDRYLESPHYGEQMARPWLDLARYADTHGLHLDNERQMWAYRDWVVKAFNRNLPYDRFTIDQLAGDLVPGASQDQQVATGFNRCNVTTSEGGSIDAEFVFRYAVERASTTMQVWLGLTAGCAVCHDHKFDPISSREFYSMYAFFHSSADPAMDGNVLLTPPVMKLATPEDRQRLDELGAEVRRMESVVGSLARVTSYADPAEANPRPPVKEMETVWVDDDVPSGWKISASPGHAPNWVTAEGGVVKRGRRALQRKDGGLSQDVLEGGTPVEVPPSGRLFAHVYLDPKDPPRTIMLQWRTDDWKHRAVWGDIDAIDWGAKGTTQRAHIGPLPELGKWVRLEFDAEKVGLKAGDKLSGIAFTQHGGAVTWDEAGVKGRVDPASDPSRSFVAWLATNSGKDLGELPGELRKVLKEVPATNRTPAQVQGLKDHYVSRVCADTRKEFAPALMELDRARKRRDEYEGGIPSTFVWRDMDKPRESFVMVRGAYDKPGEKVKRGVPAALPPLRVTSDPTRLDLAQWLMGAENPLTSRVAVNRLWQQFFGAGLVRTPDDFGSQGTPPTHPDLLDWLAVEFRDSGWNTKGFVKLLLTSATYRQESRATPEALAKDPDNRWLSRGPRFRLDAEQLRDNALFVSGLMDLRIGGKGVKPYQPANIWEPVGFVGSNTRDYRQDSGSALYRRSLYTFFKRTAPPPFMSTFDAPNRESSCARRERSNTPLQALQAMNDVQFFEAARGLATRMLAEGGRDADARIQFAFRTVLARPADAGEVRVVRTALDKHLARYRSDAAAAKAVITFGESRPPAGIDPAELAAYTLTANLVLNLDETQNRN